MGYAYGAAKPGSKGNAARIGIIIDPDGNVLSYHPKASAGGFPELALNQIA
jgi:hypothetical protein